MKCEICNEELGIMQRTTLCYKCLDKRRQRRWRQKNKNHNRQWQKDNTEKYKKLQCKWKIKNPYYMNNWKKNNPHYFKNYSFTRTKNDMDFKLRIRLSCRIRNALINNALKKAYGTIELIGCTIREYREHQEKQWQEGMNWSNYGKWEIDHIIPLSFYDLTNVEQQKMAFYYLNTQPLWKSDNRSKGNKLE